MFQRVLLSLVAFNVGVFVAKTKKVILPCLRVSESEHSATAAYLPKLHNTIRKRLSWSNDVTPFRLCPRILTTAVR